MARVIEFVDVPVSENRDITFDPDQKVIGISLNNHGSVDINYSFGNNSLLQVLSPGDSVPHGNINAGGEPAYMRGTLSIESASGWATARLVIVYCYDRTEQQDC